MSHERFPLLRREILLEASLPSTNPPMKLIRGARIRFAPGQPSGMHLHQMSTVGLVTQGSFSFQLEGEPVRTLRAGECFFEPAGHPVLHFDNAASSEPAEIVCFYLTDTEERPPINMLESGKDAQIGNV